MQALDLALRQRVIRSASCVAHAMLVEPVLEFGRDVRWPVVGQQPWPVFDICRFQTAGLKCQLERIADIFGRDAVAQIPGQDHYHQPAVADRLHLPEDHWLGLDVSVDDPGCLLALRGCLEAV